MGTNLAVVAFENKLTKKKIYYHLLVTTLFTYIPWAKILA